LAEILIIADDLSGAADCAVACMGTGLSACVVLDCRKPFTDADVIAINAGTRRMSAADAARETSRIVSTLAQASGQILYKKIDSTLRGHIGAEIAATLEARRSLDGLRAIVVMAPAFPAAGRTTRDGIQMVTGMPIGNAAHLLEAAGLRTAHFNSGKFDVRECDAIVCDAESDGDLRTIAEAGMALDVPLIWVGSAGLARHLPDATGLSRPTQAAWNFPSLTKPILFVVGSASARSLQQAAILARMDGIALFHEGITSGHDMLALIGKDNVSGMEDPELCTSLARLLGPHADRFGALVLTGGETACAVLQEYGITGLRMVKEVEPGVPLSVSIGAIELPVITKAGAFGDSDTLVRCRHALRPRG
jgi:uncharacterized protein YgbK (DUF1537 family)